VHRDKGRRKDDADLQLAGLCAQPTFFTGATALAGRRHGRAAGTTARMGLLLLRARSGDICQWHDSNSRAVAALQKGMQHSIRRDEACCQHAAGIVA
jgi:hypothetical protein